MAEAEKHALEGLAARAEFIRDSAERRKMVAAAQDAEQAVEDWLDKQRLLHSVDGTKFSSPKSMQNAISESEMLPPAECALLVLRAGFSVFCSGSGSQSPLPSLVT